MNSDGSNSGSKRRKIQAKHVKKLASNEDDSGNNRASKRGREGKAVDGDEPPVKKAASTKATVTRIEHVKTSDSYLSKTRYINCFCFVSSVLLQSFCKTIFMV